jgi:restriction system protein
MSDVWQVLTTIERGHAETVPYVLLAFAVCGALAALWGRHRRRSKRRRLWASQRSIDTLRSMSWQEFEQLTGETFRRLGFRIEETGQGGADGGLDLLLTKDGHRYAVQCKHYRAKVGAPVVRDAVGVAVHIRAHAVYVVGLSGFTKAASDYARGKPVHLIDGRQLLRMIEQGKTGRAGGPLAGFSGLGKG